MIPDTSELKKDFLDGIKAAFSSKKRVFASFLFGAAFFLLTAMSTNIGYSVQMLQSGPQYWYLALMTRTLGLVGVSGTLGLILTSIFSLLAGVVLTNTLVQFSLNRFSSDFLGTLPGLLVGGCASCGVGILSILGLGGVVASLPFQGNLLRLGGIALVAALIVRTGNPETCSI